MRWLPRRIAVGDSPVGPQHLVRRSSTRQTGYRPQLPEGNRGPHRPCSEADAHPPDARRCYRWGRHSLCPAWSLRPSHLHRECTLSPRIRHHPSIPAGFNDGGDAREHRNQRSGGVKMRRASWLVIGVFVLGLTAISSFAAGTDAEQGPVPGASAAPAQVAQMPPPPGGPGGPGGPEGFGQMSEVERAIRCARSTSEPTTTSSSPSARWSCGVGATGLARAAVAPAASRSAETYASRAKRERGRVRSLHCQPPQPVRRRHRRAEEKEPSEPMPALI